MRRFITLAIFGAITFADAKGTTNPVIIEKLQNIIAKADNESIKDAMTEIQDNYLEGVIVVDSSLTNLKLDETQENDVKPMGKDGLTKGAHDAVLKEGEESKQSPPDVKKELADVEEAMQKYMVAVEKEIEDAKK